MKIIKIEANKAEIQLSMREISALTQVFNYARSAAKIDNFEQAIGVSKKESGEFMHYFKDLRNRINPNSSVAKTIINRKNCNLRSQKYDLCFYMQKIRPKIENVRWAITLQKKGVAEIIIKTVWNTISINRVRQELSLLKDKTNSSLHQTETTSISLFNEAVELNIGKSKLKETDLVEKSQLDIEFVFPKGIRVSKVDLETLIPEAKKEESFNTPVSFTSTLTLENITNFITKVEDFFDNRVNNNLD